MPLFKDQQERILQLCGDEYIVLEAPDGFYSTKRMKLRHNICDIEYEVSIKKFLLGQRCPNKRCVNERIKQIFLKKYGVEYITQNKEIKEKVKNTIIQREGTELQWGKSQRDLFFSNLSNKFPSLEPQFSLEEYRGVNSNKYRFRCKECGYEFERTIHSHKPICRKCNPPLRGTSRQEVQVYEFISSISKDSFEQRDRKTIHPKEIDIYSEQHRVGVEFNGLYWHSEKFVDKKYHSEKSKFAREAGIKLFHVFSDEWEQKQDIVKSMLSHAFGVTRQKLFARKCSIAEVSTRDAKRFFESTHISGGGRSKSAFGLFYDGQLVSCLSLGVPIKNKRYSNCIEIVRFANQLNTHVVGGFSKLLTAAKKWALENGFENILSYADLRFGDGNVYHKNGFEYL